MRNIYHVNNTVHVSMNVFYKVIELIHDKTFNQTELSIIFTKCILFYSDLYMHIYVCVCARARALSSTL